MPFLKRSVEAVLARGGPATLARWRHTSATLVLAYHNIIPEGERGGLDRSLHLPQRAFAAQLEQLSRTHDVIPLRELLDGSPAQHRRPRVVITFDDGCLGALTAGLAELRRFGFPATFFVTPGRLGRQAFWWDRLGSPEIGGVPDELRLHALTALAGKDQVICDWAADRALPIADVPECAKTVTESELRQALAVSGISVASHTWSHPNLAALDPAALRDELARPLEWLRARWPETIPAVSYPYGLASAAVAETARATGYQAGLLIAGGWVSDWRQDLRFLIPRLNVPAGVSRDGFTLRAAGLIGG